MFTGEQDFDGWGISAVFSTCRGRSKGTRLGTTAVGGVLLEPAQPKVRLAVLQVPPPMAKNSALKGTETRSCAHAFEEQTPNEVNA